MQIEIPSAYKELFKPHRFKVYHGGRGGAKSESVARALLIEGAQQKMTILCAREFQKSIKESVYQLLKEIITNNPVFSSFYEVLNSEIRGKNGTLFLFAGLHHNIENIKSIPNIKKCWVEEAETVSDHSWDVLIPTIRGEGSEIIITFNPDIFDSPTYQRFVVSPPSFAHVQKVSYRDNPYFPAVLEQERAECERTNPLKYDNIWEGNPKAAVEGAIFANELQAATDQERIRSVPYDPKYPVHTFWDLGHSDQTAIWFIQIVGFEYRVLRYYANSQQKMHHYIHYLQQLEYNYGTHYLPHDATHEQLGQESTIKQQAEDALGSVEVVPRVLMKANAIEQARVIFPLCYFDLALCRDGLAALRRYAYRYDIENGKISKDPEHTIYSHGADALQTFGTAMAEGMVSSHRMIPGYVTQSSTHRPSPRLG